MFVDKQFLSDNFPNLQIRATDAILHHRVNPILHPDKINKERILKNFQSLYSKSLETNHRFYEEILKLQMQLFLLEMWDIFMDQLERRNRTLQSGTLYERFVQFVGTPLYEKTRSAILQRSTKHHSKISQLNLQSQYRNYRFGMDTTLCERTNCFAAGKQKPKYFRNCR